MAIKLKAASTSVRGAASPGAVVPVEMPETRVITVDDLGVSVLLIGDSGTGKTFAIGQLLEAGYNGKIVAIEPKIQGVIRWKPAVLFLGEPLRQGGQLRPPTPREMYDRLMYFRDQLGEGKHREHAGKPLDFIAIDGFLELGEVIYRYWKTNKPMSSSSGEQNSFAMWDNIAEKSVDFFKSLRDAAGFASTFYGMPPISVVATIGEQATSDKMGCVAHVPLFPGRKAPTLLPYQFEVVLRLSVRNVDGLAQYVMHTVGVNDPSALEKFYAKTPSGVFTAEITDWNFGDVFEKLLASYKVTSKEGDKE